MLTDHDKAIRERRIGASEVAAVLGISPYADATPFAVWARLTQGYQRPEANELTAGHFLERAVSDWYEHQFGDHLEVHPAEARPHPMHAWLSATPDRMVNASGGASWLLECKTDRDRDAWGEPGTDQVPVHIAAQVQIQMACLDMERCDVAVLLKSRDEFAAYTVLRDSEAIAHIAQVTGEWYMRHVTGGEMPALDGGNAAAAYLRKRYPGGAPLAVATPEQRAMVAAYGEQKAAIKRLTGEADIMRQRIALELGDSNGWEGLCTFKPNKKGVRSLLLTAEKE